MVLLLYSKFSGYEWIIGDAVLFLDFCSTSQAYSTFVVMKLVNKYLVAAVFCPIITFISLECLPLQKHAGDGNIAASFYLFGCK